MFKALWALLLALPELLELIRAIQKANQEVKTDKKIKDDLRKISEAFKDKDAKKLNDVFNS